MEADGQAKEGEDAAGASGIYTYDSHAQTAEIHCFT
jgi:hypothetical protein